MEEKVILKKGKVESDIKKINQNKAVTELLSSNLNDIKEKFKANEDDVEQMILSADDTFEKYQKEFAESLNYNSPNVVPLGSTVITSKKLLNLIEYGAQLIGAEFNVDLVSQFSTAISEKQIVLAKGPNCQQVEIGDEVSIRLEDFTRRINPNSLNSKEVTNIPVEEINGEDYLVFHEGNIKYITKDEDYNKRRINKK